MKDVGTTRSLPMWTCPRCAEAVEDEFAVCWACGTSPDGEEDPWFVTADEAGPIYDPVYDREPGIAPSAELLDDLPGPPEDPLVECFEARDVIEANYVADGLNDAGIPTLADRNNANFGVGGVERGQWGYGPKVAVRRADLERARDWLAGYMTRRKPPRWP